MHLHIGRNYRLSNSTSSSCHVAVLGRLNDLLSFQAPWLVVGLDTQDVRIWHCSCQTFESIMSESKHQRSDSLASAGGSGESSTWSGKHALTSMPLEWCVVHFISFQRAIMMQSGWYKNLTMWRTLSIQSTSHQREKRTKSWGEMESMRHQVGSRQDTNYRRTRCNCTLKAHRA